MLSSEILDGLNAGGWGVFIAPTTILVIAVDGTPDMVLFTVSCLPHQQTVGVWSGCVTPRILELNFSFSITHQIRALPFSFSFFPSLSFDLFKTLARFGLRSRVSKTLEILSFVCCTMPNHAFVLIE
jgi:hypothetical protein